MAEYETKSGSIERISPTILGYIYSVFVYLSLLLLPPMSQMGMASPSTCIPPQSISSQQNINTRQIGIPTAAYFLKGHMGPASRQGEMGIQSETVDGNDSFRMDLQVINLSEITLSNDEINHLKKGFTFTSSPAYNAFEFDNVLILWDGTESMFHEFVQVLSTNVIGMRFTSEINKTMIHFLDLTITLGEYRGNKGVSETHVNEQFPALGKPPSKTPKEWDPYQPKYCIGPHKS